MTPCDTCPIRINCDFLSGMCRLSAAGVVKHRPDLLKPAKEALSYQQTWYERNKTKVKQKAAKWNAEHKERRREIQRRWKYDRKLIKKLVRLNASRGLDG
jgi:hypothetical protein